MTAAAAVGIIRPFHRGRPSGDSPQRLFPFAVRPILVSPTYRDMTRTDRSAGVDRCLCAQGASASSASWAQPATWLVLGVMAVSSWLPAVSLAQTAPDSSAEGLAPQFARGGIVDGESSLAAPFANAPLLSDPACPPEGLEDPTWRERFGELIRPEGRHRGLGHPLLRESWLFRRFSAGWFMGMAQGGDLIEDRFGRNGEFSGGVAMQRGFVGGYRLGWDSDYYWGGEMRFAFASAEIVDTPLAQAAQQAADTEAGIAADDPWRRRFEQRRDASLLQWDADLLYYPWGDSQWRPYLAVGLGTGRIRLTDRLSHRYDAYLFTVPMAIGLKYRYNDRLALRADLTDYIAHQRRERFSTLHTFAATLGVEVRFGGTRTAYWPWNPGRHYW